MKKAIAIKTFNDSGSGMRKHPGDVVTGPNDRIGELERNGMVTDVEDVSDEENALEGQELARAALLGATMDEGTGARVSIGFANATHANAFREGFLEMQTHAHTTAPAERPERQPRQVKPAPGRQTKPAPEPTQTAAALGAGGEGAADTSGTQAPAGEGQADGASPPPIDGNSGTVGESGITTDTAGLGETTTAAAPAERQRRGNRATADA